MKFAVFLALSCACICIAQSLSISTWGNTFGRVLGTKNITIGSSFMQRKNITFTYPPGKSAFVIHGIKHLDYKSHPSAVKFLNGFIGSRNVTIQVQSQRGNGINSTFIFYTL